MVSISAEHLYSTDVMSIFAIDGSIGNSFILRPAGVRSPTLSSAPRTQSWYMELRMLGYIAGKYELLLPILKEDYEKDTPAEEGP